MRTAIAPPLALAAALCLSAHPAVSCEIRMTTKFADTQARWIGPCKSGVVEGYGVMAYRGKGRGPTFYGFFANGIFERGAIEDLDGIRSLRAKDGIISTEYDGRSERVTSMRMAVDGARAASEWLKSNSQRAEAKAYAEKADALQDTAFTFNVP